MLSLNDIVNFCNGKNYDIRVSHNARWIDQKCTPDVMWSVCDFVLHYIDNVNTNFTASDIWHSDYAKLTIAETYSKPGIDEKAAENEYDKVFSQPLCLLCYAGIIKDISVNARRHLYEVVNREMLEYIAMNDIYSLRFLQVYIEKVLKDSNLFSFFDDFFIHQDKSHFNKLKSKFIDFYHRYTPVKRDYEPKRIFIKVINPLAHKYSKCGTRKGKMSNTLITKADMMYNKDNFRDIYRGKPKNITRKQWLKMNPDIDLRIGYFEQMLSKAKKIIRDNAILRGNISELTQFNSNYNDRTPATQIHHIFPQNEFPEIKHYCENLIALTPNQHYNFAHPDNNTQIVDMNAQKWILIAKTSSIKENINNSSEETIYDFANLLYILHVGWSDDDVLDIENNNFSEVVHSINCHYK